MILIRVIRITFTLPRSVSISLDRRGKALTQPMLCVLCSHRLCFEKYFPSKFINTHSIVKVLKLFGVIFLTVFIVGIRLALNRVEDRNRFRPQCRFWRSLNE